VYKALAEERLEQNKLLKELVGLREQHKRLLGKHEQLLKEKEEMLNKLVKYEGGTSD
jgi:hypothetical protein